MACLLSLLFISAQAAPSSNMTRMTEQLDQLDQLDFQDAVAKAEKCTRAHDFICTEAQLAKARKVATGTAAKNTVRQAEKNLAAEKEAVVVAKRKAEEEDETSSANRTKVCERECRGRDLYSLCLDAIWKTDYFEEIRARCAAPQQPREAETDSSPGVLAAVQGALANSRQSAAQLAGIHNQLLANLAQQDANRREAARRVSEGNNRAVLESNAQTARNNAQQAAAQERQERVQAQQIAQQRAEEQSQRDRAASSKREALAPAVEALIVERNPYVVDQRPARWRDRTVAPWRLATGLSPGSSWTRGEACERATIRGNDTIKLDNLSGVRKVTAGLTDCICHNDGSDSPIRRMWVCEVYYQYQ